MRKGQMFLPILLLFTAAAASDVDIGRQRTQYWNERGLENPSRRLREVADNALLYFNTSIEMRPVLLLTIATPASIHSVLPRLLENLNTFKSNDQVNTYGNRDTSLAEHTIVATTNMDTQHGCDGLAEKYRHKCYELDHGFNGDVQDLLQISRTKAHSYSVGLSRIKALVDLVSLGYDILYFDLHHYFFKNPLKYMYEHTTAPLVVASPFPSCQPARTGPDGTLPGEHHRLDVAFVRSLPATFRCLYNWLYWSCHTSHDAKDKPLDHFTFRNIVQDCVGALGESVISVQYLDPALFPSACHTQCGCQDGAPIAPQGDGSCAKDVMSNWVSFLFSCSTNAGDLDILMNKYSSMYRTAGLTVAH